MIALFDVDESCERVAGSSILQALSDPKQSQAQEKPAANSANSNSVKEECPIKSVGQECQARVSDKSMICICFSSLRLCDAAA